MKVYGKITKIATNYYEVVYIEYREDGSVKCTGTEDFSHERLLKMLVGVAINGKKKQYDAMISITLTLTSDTWYHGTLTEYDKGWYLEVMGTQSGFKCFVDYNCNVIRKPVKTTLVKKFEISGYESMYINQPKYNINIDYRKGI